ncbi:MAG: hypothetical protein ACXWRE_09560 [Pseudobdellovibrionaceae bacterium]
MRWISLLVSFIIGKINSARPPSLKELASAIMEEAAYRSRRPVVLLLSGLICILFLCGGFFMSLIDLTSQFDRNGFIQFTASTAGGVILVLFSLSVFFWIFTSAWPGTQEKKMTEMEAPAQPTSSLEHALSLLVMDFIKEREFKRQQQQQQQQAQYSPPYSQQYSQQATEKEPVHFHNA